MLVGRKEREGMIVEERGGKTRVKEREREKATQNKAFLMSQPSLHLCI